MNALQPWKVRGMIQTSVGALQLNSLPWKPESCSSNPEQGFWVAFQDYSTCTTFPVTLPDYSRRERFRWAAQVCCSLVTISNFTNCSERRQGRLWGRTASFRIRLLFGNDCDQASSGAAVRNEDLSASLSLCCGHAEPISRLLSGCISYMPVAHRCSAEINRASGGTNTAQMTPEIHFH